MSASPREALVAAHVLGDGVRLFDAATLAPLPFADAAPGSMFVGFSPSGQQLVSLEDHQIPRLYDVPSGQPSRQQPGGAPEGFRVPAYTWQNAVEVAFSRNGSRMVAELQPPELPGGRSTFGQTMVWDLADPSEPVFTVRLPALTQSALSPDGNRLFVVTRRDRPLRVYDVASGRPIASTRSPLLARLGANGIDLSPDGSTLAVAVGNDVLRYDAATLRPRRPALGQHLLVSEGGARTDAPRSRPPRHERGRRVVRSLAPLLQAFFADRLMTQRQARPHTIAGYRDSQSRPTENTAADQVRTSGPRPARVTGRSREESLPALGSRHEVERPVAGVDLLGTRDLLVLVLDQLEPLR